MSESAVTAAPADVARTPVLVFHAAQDDLRFLVSVPVTTRLRETIEASRAALQYGDLRLTLTPGAGVELVDLYLETPTRVLQDAEGDDFDLNDLVRHVEEDGCDLLSSTTPFSAVSSALLSEDGVCFLIGEDRRSTASVSLVLSRAGVWVEVTVGVSHWPMIVVSSNPVVLPSLD